MSYYYDEHDEDDLPEVSIPVKHRTISSSDDEDEQENDQTKSSLEKWKGLHEASVHSLQSDDDDDNYNNYNHNNNQPKATSNEKPFYLEQQISVERPASERPESPVHEINTPTKSKWQIHLPELLNSTVGPDRQKRAVTRRHTTNIVFQHAPEANGQSTEIITNPLVKQLKQKFDQMSVEPTDVAKPKLQRIGSLTRRRLTANVTQQLIQQTISSLPIQSTPEIVFNKPPRATQPRKSGPPVSYSKHFYPPPSTTSVVRQLIDSGATLVYDSKTPKISSNKIKPLIENQRNIEQTREELINSNVPLTGRQIKNKNNHQARRPALDESDDEYHDAETRHRSNSVKN